MSREVGDDVLNTVPQRTRMVMSPSVLRQTELEEESDSFLRRHSPVPKALRERHRCAPCYSFQLRRFVQQYVGFTVRNRLASNPEAFEVCQRREVEVCVPARGRWPYGKVAQAWQRSNGRTRYGTLQKAGQ